MLLIAICEDEPIMLEELSLRVKTYLEDCKESAEIFKFYNGEELLLSGRDFDLVFMDIKLSGLDGMETVQKIRSLKKDSMIIFVTSYKSYVFQAFYVDAVHYLIKPVSDHDLFFAIDKALSKLKQKDCQTISITKGNEVQIFYLRDILYCESIDHEMIIHTKMELYHYFGTLENLQTKLDERFFRCHRSYIVNMSYVISKEKESAKLINGETILISRRRQQEFTKRLLMYFQKEVLP